MTPSLFDRDGVERQVRDKRDSFLSARPFPHAALDNVLRPEVLRRVQAVFPGPAWPQWVPVEHEMQPGKRTCAACAEFPPLLARLACEFGSSWFLRQLETLTGIEGLLADPHLYGGGLHATAPGGWVAPHADFIHGQNNGLVRRLSVILYIGPGGEGDGGVLSLWTAGKRACSLPPRPNSIALFRVGKDAVHGVEPVTGTTARQSLAMFYYTAAPDAVLVNDAPADWHFELVETEISVGAFRKRAGRWMLGASLILHGLYVAANRCSKRLVGAPRLREASGRSLRRK